MVSIKFWRGKFSRPATGVRVHCACSYVWPRLSCDVLRHDNRTSTHALASVLAKRRFFRYSASIYWLVHGHMKCNNEIVYRQMTWAGNIAKNMTWNGKQFTVPANCWPLLHMQLKVAWCCRWNLSAFFSKFGFVLFCYITNHLMNDPLINSEFCFPRISMFPRLCLRETLRFSGNTIHCSPRDQSSSVNCCIAGVFPATARPFIG